MFRYETLGGRGGGGIDHYHYQSISLGGGDLAVFKSRRVTSLPLKFQTPASRKLAGPDSSVNNPPAKPTAAGKVHPILGLLDPRRRKKAAAKPEFARYLQYIKEGGVWDAESDKPTIYFI